MCIYLQNKYLLAIKFIYWQLNLFFGNKIMFFEFKKKNVL